MAGTEWAILLYCSDLSLLFILDVGEGYWRFNRVRAENENDRRVKARIRCIIARMNSGNGSRNCKTPAKLVQKRIIYINIYLTRITRPRFQQKVVRANNLINVGKLLEF